jgi:hypothetical protein
MKKKLLLLMVLSLPFLTVFAQVTYNVTVPDGTNACYISGDMNGWKFDEMVKVDATHYTITIPGATTSQGYKYLSGPSWSYEERYANGSWRGNRTYSAADVVEKWLAVYTPAAPKINITVRARTPWDPTYIHFWGDAVSEWPGVLMTQVGDWWEYTFSNVTTMNFIFNDNAGAQTADILTITANTCFQVNSDNSYSKVDCSTFSSTNTLMNSGVNINSEKSKISVKYNDGTAKLQIFNVHGAVIYNADFNENITVDNLKTGLYFLKINNETFKTIVK